MAGSQHRVKTRPALQKRVGSPDDEIGKWREKVQFRSKTHKAPGKSKVNCIYTCKVPDYVQRDDDAVKETSGKLTLGKVVLLTDDCATTRKEQDQPTAEQNSAQSIA